MHTTLSNLNIQDFRKMFPVFDGLPTAVVMVRYPQEIIETANNSFSKLIGKTLPKHKLLSDIFPKQKNQNLWTFIQKVFSNPYFPHKKNIKIHLQKSPETSYPCTTEFCEVTCHRLLDTSNRASAIAIFFNLKKPLRSASHKKNIDIFKFATSFNASTSGFIILKGPDFVFQTFNHSYKRFLPNRKLDGIALGTAIPEIIGQKIYTQLIHTYKTGKTSWGKETPIFLREDSSKIFKCFYLDFIYTRIWIESDSCYGIMVQYVDKTDIMENKKSLKNTSSQYNRAIKAAKMGFWDIHLPTQKANYSPRCYEMFGFSTDVQLTSYDFISRIHPADTATVFQAISQVFSAVSGKQDRIESKFRIQLPDQTIRWVQAIGQCFFEDINQTKVATHITGLVYDITEHTESHEQSQASQRLFKQISDLLPQFVWTAHPDGQLDYTNKKWEQCLGTGAKDNWMTRIHPDEKNNICRLWEKSIHACTAFHAEFRLHNIHDNSYRWFLAQAEPAYNIHGQVEKWVGVCTDIAAQKEVLEERKKFISIASHELRTPLTSLQLQTQTLKRRCNKHDDNALLPDIIYRSILNNEKQIERLSLLVNEMLDFSCIESGMLSLHKTNENLCDIVREVIDRLSSQLESFNIQTHISIPNELIACMDRFRIDQAITNILTNAIKYGKKNPIHIYLSQNTSCAILEITDHGIGIAPYNLTRIFNRFERAISANEVSGLGIGLYLTQRIIHEHGGHIRVHSILGSGSTFKINIPLQ